MTEQREERPGAGYTIAGWRGGQSTLTAAGPTPAAALAAGLDGILAAYRDEIGAGSSADAATTALPLRAEGGDLATVFAALASALLDEIDHADGDVQAVRLDGLLRTDEGLTVWGYALASPGGAARVPMTVNEPHVTEDAGTVVIRATLRRVDPGPSS
jgi:hypothetical protein